MENKYITVRILAPEGYEDVCDELILEDFLTCPNAFDVELCKAKEEKSND